MATEEQSSRFGVVAAAAVAFLLKKINTQIQNKNPRRSLNPLLVIFSERRNNEEEEGGCE